MNERIVEKDLLALFTNLTWCSQERMPRPKNWASLVNFYSGSILVSGKLPSYPPSPKPMLTLTFELGRNLRLGEG